MIVTEDLSKQQSRDKCYPLAWGTWLVNERDF